MDIGRGRQDRSNPPVIANRRRDGKRPFARRSSIDDAGFSDIAEPANAGPGLPVRVTDFDARQIALVCQPHVDAHQRVSEPRNSAFGQDEMGRRTALGAEMNFRVRVVLIGSTISFCRAVDSYLRRLEISPASSRFTAQCAVAFIDVFWLPFHGDADVTAKARKRHRVITLARGSPRP